MISNFEKSVAFLIMNKRRDLGLTQEQLDTAMGFKGSFIGKVESYVKSVNLDHINKLAIIFNCSPKELIPEKYIKQD
jgi:ribosome-binding protein aMBF1 (putative translation factor)